MIRWLLLFIALFVTGLGLLTTFKAPSWVNGMLGWYLTWLAGAYGHLLVALPLAAGVVAWQLRRGHPVSAALTLAFCAVAAGLLLKPVVQAWRLGRALPARLEAAFGPIGVGRAPVSLAALFSGWPKPVKVETMDYADSLKVDFYRAVGRSPAPCVVVIHGGGWCIGDRHEIRQLDQWLAQHGYAVAAIDYRLAPFTPWPAQIAGAQRWFQPPREGSAPPGAIWPAQCEDVLGAIAFLQTRAAALGIDPDRFVLLGRSAGGHLAEVTAYATRDPAIRGLVALYAPTDLRSMWEHRPDDLMTEVGRQFTRQFLGGTPVTIPVAYDNASPIRLVGPGLGLPPTLLIHGQLDTFVWHSQSQLLAEKLAAAGVPQTLVSLPWATHVCEADLHSPAGQITTYALEWFLAAVTKDAGFPPWPENDSKIERASR